MWYVIGLIWIALIAGIIFMYNRRQRRRSAEQEKKVAALLADLKSGSAAGMKAGPAAAAAVVPAASAEFRKKQRLLPQSTALLYYVFRTGLPDHEIFTGLTLADVLEPGAAASLTGSGRTTRLLTQRLDLVVCTRQLEVVAGVVIDAGAGQGSSADFIAPCLQAAGIRMVRINPAATPRHHQVRELVYGEGA